VSGPERLELGPLQPPQLRATPAGAQQRIGQSVLDAIAQNDTLVLAKLGFRHSSRQQTFAQCFNSLKDDRTFIL
jgi:hypothetical protein